MRFWRRREIRRRQACDRVLVLAAQFSFLFDVAAGLVADQGAGPLAGDALEGVVDFIVQQEADGAGGRGGLRESAAGASAGGRGALGGGDEELAMHGIGRGVVAADFEFFFEPVEGFGSFEGPNDVHGFGDGFGVAHFFDQVEELADDGSDAAAAGEEDDGVEGGEVALHAAVGAVDEGAVGLVRAIFRGGVEDFAGEAAEGAEDEGHVSVLLAVVGGEVFATQGSDGEWVVLEDGDAGHSQIDILARMPLYLRWDCYFDGVLWKHCNCCFFPNQP